METLVRAQKITYEVINGGDILERGHETARRLWNYTRWCLIGYNENLRRQRGDDWDRFKRNQAYNQTGEKYPGRFVLQKELKDHWTAKDLSDRCFSETIKDFDVAMRSWFSNLKSNPKAKPPRYSKIPRILKFQVGRNVKPVGNMIYQLTVLGGHIKERHVTIRLKIKPGIKMSEIDWIYLHPDGSGVAIHDIEATKVTGNGIAAIDLGIINIATVAYQDGTSVMYSGKALLSANQWANKQSAKCKPKNWSKGKQQEGQSKKFKAYRRKAGNITKLATHNLTRHIIDDCVIREVGTLVIGDLKGIREDADHGKKGNQRLHAWPFAMIRRQLEYKAQEVGIEVLARSERNTSKLHHLTKEKGVRKPRGLVTFKKAGQIIHSDVNGAFGILNNYLDEIGQAKVSPVPAIAGIGVEAIFPGLPSLSVVAEGTGEAQSVLQIHPTFVCRFNPRGWSIVQAIC